MTLLITGHHFYPPASARLGLKIQVLFIHAQLGNLVGKAAKQASSPVLEKGPPSPLIFKGK